MANQASVSGSEGYNIPVNALDGGDAAPSEAISGPSNAGGGTGAIGFNDGAFQVGGADNSAPSTATQSLGGTSTEPPAVYSNGLNVPLVPASSSSNTILLIALAGGAVLLWLMLRKK